MNGSFFHSLLRTLSERANALLVRDKQTVPSPSTENLLVTCERLLSGVGEASSVALAFEILHDYARLDEEDRSDFFSALAERFGPNNARIARAVNGWNANPSDNGAMELHAASEPRCQELLRRLNLAPNGTLRLVRMREHLLSAPDPTGQLATVDATFAQLFSSWFNRGFLVLRRIDWTTPATVLEKLIRYEAVHQIQGWHDLRSRLAPLDRRCFAFFHPALIDEPLIFVEVALAQSVPSAIAPILSNDRTDFVTPEKAKVAIFYSISNCQRGLSGVSFGNFLIKQVIEEIRKELPNVSTFVTLSPTPTFTKWLSRELASNQITIFNKSDLAALSEISSPNEITERKVTNAHAPLMRAIAYYYLRAKTKDDLPIDPVARFHLSNGARLERINWLGDTSAKGLSQGCGFMANYLYDSDAIVRNHEAYKLSKTIMASPAVHALIKEPATMLLAHRHVA